MSDLKHDEKGLKERIRMVINAASMDIAYRGEVSDEVLKDIMTLIREACVVTEDDIEYLNEVLDEDSANLSMSTKQIYKSNAAALTKRLQERLK